MMTSYFDLLKYAATGISSPDMTYYDRMRASTLMGGAVQTLTGIPPLSFKADGKPLISWSMKGNGQQTGTPTPDNPVMPEFVGTLDDTDWTIPITCAEQTVTVNLGQVSTVRWIKKLVLTGEEDWFLYTNYNAKNAFQLNASIPSMPDIYKVSDRYLFKDVLRAFIDTDNTFMMSTNTIRVHDSRYDTTNAFMQYLRDQYAAGTPVTVWYVLASPTEGIVNEPLCKIGDYADELSSTDAAVTIPTVKGANTLTVDTTVQPSEVSITGRIKQA
jgi:hypothetical protein